MFTSGHGGFLWFRLQKTAESPQLQFMMVVDVPSVPQRLISMVLATMQIPQLFVDKASTALCIWQTLVRSSPVEHRIMDFSGR